MSSPLSARSVALILAAILAAGPASIARADEKPSSVATSRVEIRVEDRDGRSVANAEVVLESLERTGESLRGSTGSNGEVSFAPVAYGHYRVAIQAGDEAYPSNRTILVRPERSEEFEFTLGGFRPEDERLGLRAGTRVAPFDKPAAGVARLAEDLGPKGWAWLRTGPGVATVVGGGALIVGLLIVTSEDDDEDVVSPVE